jgi:hypothetical protein
MVNRNDFIHHKNVVSQSYLVPANRFADVMNTFFRDISEANLSIRGLPFFIMLPQDENKLYLKCYVPVEENDPILPEGMEFDSYFGIDKMASITVCGDVDQNSETAFKELYDYLEESELTATTPVYSVLHSDKGFKYVSYKLGYCPNDIFNW